jgi:hypothetical protein
VGYRLFTFNHIKLKYIALVFKLYRSLQAFAFSPFGKNLKRLFVSFIVFAFFLLFYLMNTSQINLQALIAENEALGWDGPSRLESLPIEHPKQATFGLIGKHLFAKPPHPQWVHDTLVAT